MILLKLLFPQLCEPSRPLLLLATVAGHAGSKDVANAAPTATALFQADENAVHHKPIMSYFGGVVWVKLELEIGVVRLCLRPFVAKARRL